VTPTWRKSTVRYGTVTPYCSRFLKEHRKEELEATVAPERLPGRSKQGFRCRLKDGHKIKMVSDKLEIKPNPRTSKSVKICRASVSDAVHKGGVSQKRPTK
jgi:hypothetical protein